MERAQVKKYAEYLNSAELDRKDVFRLTLENPELTMDEGYEIQREIVKLKLAAGHKLSGMKMGVTSEVKMVQMKISEPIYGHLFDYMYVADGTQLHMDELIHPRAESEIAFILKKNLSGADLTIEEVMEATEYVLPVMEIVDSRFENFNFKLPDVVADNSSSSRYIVGSKLTRPQGIDLARLGVTLSFNGEIVDQGAGAAVLGHPANSVIRLAKMLSALGEEIKAGQIILTGGITKALAVKAGDVVTTKIEELGEVSFTAV